MAYMLREKGDVVSKRWNAEMGNVYQLIECDDAEIKAVRARLEKHVAVTDSARGQYVLDNWNDILPKFIKILPSDYERVLNAVKRAEESGLEWDEYSKAAFDEYVKAGN